MMNKNQFISLLLFSLVAIKSPVDIKFVTMAGHNAGTVQLPETKREALELYFEKSDGLTIVNQHGTRILAELLGTGLPFVQKMFLINEGELTRDDESLILNIVMKKQRLVCTTMHEILGPGPDPHGYGDDDFTMQTKIVIDDLVTHENGIIGHEFCMFGLDVIRQTSCICSRSAMATPNLLLWQFFGKAHQIDEGIRYHEYEQVYGGNPDIHPLEYDTYDFRDHVITPSHVFGHTGIQYSRPHHQEYMLYTQSELVQLLKFLSKKTETILPRLRANLDEFHPNQYEPNYDIITLQDIAYYGIHNSKFPSLNLIPECLETFGITQEQIDSAADYIPVTAILAYDVTHGLHFAFFCHKPNGKATMIFHSTSLSQTLFTKRWHKYFPTQNGAYFEDDPNYNASDFNKYLSFVSNYLSAPVYIEYDPFKQLMPRSIHSWILTGESDDRIPPAGVMLNRITFEQLSCMVQNLEAGTGPSNVHIETTLEAVQTLFGPRHADDGRSDSSEGSSSEYEYASESGESELPVSDSESEVSVCQDLTDDGF